MRSATHALLWEIWHRHRPVVAAIVGLTIAGRLLDFIQRAAGGAGSKNDTSLLVELMGMLSFLLLFGILNYTDSSGGRGFGSFPQRLFTLPVSSLRLVAVPVLTAIVSVELLFVLWREPLWRGGSTSVLFVAVLLGALTVFFQAILWTLEFLGSLRLVVVGAAAVIVVWIGALPAPSPWRSEGTLAVLVAGMATVAFLLAWRHVVGMRCGGAHTSLRLERLVASAAAAIPARRRAFASPLAAHFWFEWRCSGLVLPILVGGMIVIILGPLSWLMRDRAADTFRLLLGTLATPVVLAIPVGLAFARPTFWSEDLTVPEFVAVRPLTDEDIIAIKVKVAMASAVVSWLLVLSFIGIWLPLWANLDSVSRFAIQLWAFHGHSVAAVYGLAALIVIAGMLLTWRFLVSRLWSGMSGRRALLIASAMSVVIVVIAGLAFDADRLPGWLLEDPARMAAVVWIASIAVTVKYWLAAYSWRRVSARYARQYLLLWGAGTMCLLILAVLLWRVVRIYVALDSFRFQSLMILISLLAVPLARVGLAPSSLGRNRHRRR
jgi:hypothetical protein